MNQSIEKTLTNQQTKYQMTRAFEGMVIHKGFRYYEPEAFEPYEAFMKINARVRSESMVKLIDHQGAIVSLRPDVTTSLINNLIPHIKNGGPLKIFYSTDVFYHNQHGAIEKAAQFGVEHLADQDHQAADIEIITLMIEMLETLAIDYRLEIGHRKFLDVLFEVLHVNNEDLKTLKRLIAEKNVSGLNAWQYTMDFNQDQRLLLSALFKLEGTYQTIESIIKPLPFQERFKDILLELNHIKETIEKNHKLSKVTFDLSMLSQYDYYQGLTFQGFITNARRAVLKGGRYNPFNALTNRRVPAIGFMVDMDAIIKEVMQRG